MIDKIKIQQLRKLIDASAASLEQARALLGDGGSTGAGADRGTSDLYDKAAQAGSVSASGGARIIEGVFDGQSMVGPDGKKYSIPANYASKSKLVEGDLMKLTIDRTGSFVYKQIGPVERDRRTGVLMQDPETDEYQVLADGALYRVLLASVTYYKGEPGDEVVVLVPKGKQATWGAVENIIKELPGGSSAAILPRLKEKPALLQEELSAEESLLPRVEPAPRKPDESVPMPSPLPSFMAEANSDLSEAPEHTGEPSGILPEIAFPEQRVQEPDSHRSSSDEDEFERI